MPTSTEMCGSVIRPALSCRQRMARHARATKCGVGGSEGVLRVRQAACYLHAHKMSSSLEPHERLAPATHSAVVFAARSQILPKFSQRTSQLTSIPVIM
jgi:hypothetical protein